MIAKASRALRTTGLTVENQCRASSSSAIICRKGQAIDELLLASQCLELDACKHQVLHFPL